MLKYFYYRMLRKSHFKKSFIELKRLESKLLSPEMRFALPFAYRGKGFYKTIEPRQNAQEIEELYRLVCELSPKRILELGTARGGTLYLWTQAAMDDALIVSVDLPDGDFGGAYPEEKIPLYQAFARSDQRLYLLRKNSHDPETVSDVRQLLKDDLFDFAFIDGDHTYEGVKEDFNRFYPLVRSGGIIAFHDTLPRPDMPAIQVDRFWKELKSQYRTKDIIGGCSSGRKIGIGVLFVDKI